MMSYRQTGRRVAALALAACVLLAPALARQEAARECAVRVTLLQVNDVYQFLPVDRGARGGLARLSTLRQQISRESPNTLFLMAGDTISPSVESIAYKGRQMIDAWNQIGLDLAVFGNHEFDFGPDVLRERVSESRFKWVNANVYDTKRGQTFADTPPFVVREFQGVKVGVFGLVLPETKTTSSPGPDVEFRDVCETAKKVIPQMRAEGVNAVVALTHLSLREDKELARCAPGIDVIVGGHEHTLLQSSSAGVPIFKMTADARELNRIDLHLNPSSGRVLDIDWQVIPVTDAVAEDPQFDKAVTAKYGAQLKELAARVGHSGVELDARSEALRTQETNAGDLVADAFRQATGADVGLVNGGSIRADALILPGVITLRDVLSLLPFGNELVVLEMKGSTLREALEHGVARSGPGSEPGRFPQVSGLGFAFDATRPAGSRVGEVTVGGKPLDPARTYRVAMTRFVAEGGDQYAMFKGLPNVLKQKVVDSEALRRAIASVPSVAPRTEGRIRRLDRPAAKEPCKP